MDEELDVLVAGILAGDAQAEGQLCRLMRPELLRLATRLLAGGRQRAEEAEDAVQDGLLRFISTLRGRGVFHGRPRSYLRRIVYNRCLDYIKLAERSRTDPLPSDAEVPLPVAEDIENRLKDVTPAELAEGLDRLDAKCRRLLERLYFEGVTARAIAEERSPATSLQAVYYQRNFCLRRLAFLLNIWADSRFGSGKSRGKP